MQLELSLPEEPMFTRILSYKLKACCDELLREGHIVVSDQVFQESDCL